MTFTISEEQLVICVAGYFAIHFAMLYLAMKWWSPKLPMVLWRDRYLPAPPPVALPVAELPVAEHHPDDLCLGPEPSHHGRITITRAAPAARGPSWRLIDDCIEALHKLGHKKQDARRIVLNVVDKDDTVESVIAKAYAKPKAT